MKGLLLALLSYLFAPGKPTDETPDDSDMQEVGDNAMYTARGYVDQKTT